jgi:hypothetical protein
VEKRVGCEDDIADMEVIYDMILGMENKDSGCCGCNGLF